MSSRFTHVCHALCELAGLAPVQPGRDEDGALFAEFTVNEVAIHLLCESGSAERFFSRVIFGPLQPPDDPQQWGGLLEANFFMCDGAGAAFSRDIWTHDVVLQQPWLADTQPHVLFDTLARQCQVARNWQSGNLGLPAMAGAGFTADPTNQPCMTSDAFNALCSSFGEAVGAPDLAVHELPSGITAMLLGIGGADVQICRLVSDPARVHVVVDIGRATALPVCAAGNLAEINTWLLSHPQGARVCRRPVTHDYVLWVALPLDGALTGALLLQDVRGRVAAARSIREGLAAAPQAAMNHNQFAREPA